MTRPCLCLQNRSFDHLFGFAAKLLGVDGVKGDETNLKNLSNPSQGSVTIDSNSPYCGLCDPDHGTTPTTAKLYGRGNASAGDPPTMDGFIDFENSKGNARLDWCGVMSMFTPDRIPVITALAQEFAIMDRFFCSHPGPTWPNRMYALSATSSSSTSTGTWCVRMPAPSCLRLDWAWFRKRLFGAVVCGFMVGRAMRAYGLE